MASTKKRMSRLSSFLLASTKSSDGSKSASNSSLSDSSPKKITRAPPSKTASTDMIDAGDSTTSAWPLPDPSATSPGLLPTVNEPKKNTEDTPQISSSPVEDLSSQNFSLPALTPKIKQNPAHHYVQTSASSQRPRSNSSSIKHSLQQNGSNASLTPNTATVNGYGNHSTTDLLKPKKASLLLKRQKSENTLRQNAAPISSGNRAVSTPFHASRGAPPPPMPQSLHQSTTMPNQSVPEPPRLQPKKSKSWLFGGGNSSNPKKLGHSSSVPAWVAGVGEKIPYDLTNLTGGAKVPELWNENGNVIVHLFPRSSNFGPQFRLNAEHIASSSYLASLAHGKVNSSRSSRHSSVSQGPVTYDPKTQRINANIPGGSSCGNSPNASHTDSSDDSREQDPRMADLESKEIHLYVPVDLSNLHTPSLSELDIQKLILVRNLFAFLIGQSLIATPKCSSIFHVFVQIANLLLEYGFSNMDCSTFGEVANASFTCYAEELGLLDVRASPAKAVEGLILGERMRSAVLWNEAFTHAVGRYNDIQNLAVPLINSLSPVAKQRVERAHMNLEKRLLRIHSQIALFEFPSIFSGLMNSRTATEGKITNFEQWKSGFQNTRRFLINHLKARHKSWPPKRARGSGESVPALSRSVLQGVYNDLVVLYDLLVDRRHPSSRLMIFGRNFPPHADRRIEALRKVLQEYDQSGSPTYPVMPFDAPRLPRMGPGDDDALDPQRVSKTELAALLKGSYNQDTSDQKHPIAQSYMTYEFKTATGMTIDKVANFRLGSWLFIYCVIQALPMLTVDAPGVIFKEGVEYFLCEPPRGRLHWSKEGQQWEWFRDPLTGVVAQLAKDTVDLSDEAMYKLSHCWTQGVIWEKEMIDMPGRFPKAESQRKTSVARSVSGQSPPASERRFSGASSVQGTQVATQAPQHLSLQSLYINSQESYSPAGSQPPTPRNGSPQLLGIDRSGSPAPMQHLPYQASPEMKMSPEMPGIEYPPLMPGILEDFPAAIPRAPRNQSPHSAYGGLGRHNNRESIFMSGLERLPVPAASSPVTREQRAARTASMTFDEILGSAPFRGSAPNSPNLPQERNKSRVRQSSRQSTR